MRQNNTPLKASLHRDSRSPFRNSRRKKIEEFNPGLYITSRFREEDILNIKQAFDCYDSVGAGILNPNDLKLALFHQNFHATKDTVYSIIAEYDEECLGGLNFAAFMKIISSEPTEKETILEMKKMFRKFDKDNKGFIDSKDFKQVALSLGESLQEAQIDLILTKIDKKKGTRIDFEDFCRVMHHPMSYY